MGKDKKQTTTTTLDPSSQGFVDRTRRQAGLFSGDVLNQAQPFFLGPESRPISEIISQFRDPFLTDRIGGLRAEFDRLRADASRDVRQEATAAGAFGSAKQGALESSRLRNLDRDEISQTAGFLSNDFRNALSQGLAFNREQRAALQQQALEPLFRRQQALQFLTGGLGPTGQVSTEVQEGNLFKDFLGAGVTLGGLLTGQPQVAAAGASQFTGGFEAPSFLPEDTNSLFRRFGQFGTG